MSALSSRSEWRTDHREHERHQETSMKLGLEGKIALVTGGSKGIGFACARLFAEEGASVVIVSRSIEHLHAAQATLRAEGFSVATFACDLRNADDAAKVVGSIEEELGPIDILVTSAGAAKRYAPEMLTPQAWHDTMDAKYFATIHVLDPVVKRMAERGRGAVVNIVGQGGKVAGVHHIAGGAANSAIMLATAGLASAYAKKGVRINAINPGATMTSRVREALKLEAEEQGITEEEALSRAQARIPLGRLAQPEDIAKVAAFLASNQSAYVTGAIIPMDGCSTPVI
jgi:NAD(P)-dependent dehydrogenase (short-subunit alcohol dehydrogenase family)